MVFIIKGTSHLEGEKLIISEIVKESSIFEALKIFVKKYKVRNDINIESIYISEVKN